MIRWPRRRAAADHLDAYFAEDVARAKMPPPAARRAFAAGDATALPICNAATSLAALDVIFLLFHRTMMLQASYAIYYYCR